MTTSGRRPCPPYVPNTPERIVVPFAWETQALGVEAQWTEYGWYRRELSVPEHWAGQHVVLHFGAVHHAATVWVNGTRVGEHEGGYTPFEFDITRALGTETSATVLVRVWAPVDKREIVHGKQRSLPRDVYDVCAFTPSSGIWQPVWLEARPATYLSEVALTSAPSLDAVIATVSVAGPNIRDARVTVRIAGSVEESIVLAPDTHAAADADSDGSKTSITLTVPIVEPRLWRPEDPHLYSAEQDGAVEFAVRISHHGPEPPEVSVLCIWSAPFADDVQRDAAFEDLAP